jgi:hypothetical protein
MTAAFWGPLHYSAHLACMLICSLSDELHTVEDHEQQL